MPQDKFEDNQSGEPGAQGTRNPSSTEEGSQLPQQGRQRDPSKGWMDDETAGQQGGAAKAQRDRPTAHIEDDDNVN